MTAFNIVRFRVKPGRDADFLAAHRKAKFDFRGARRATLVKTGPQTYCILGEWTNMNAIAAARPHMIAILDTFRDALEELGSGLGVTDPISGDVVMEIRAAKPKSAAAKARAAAPKSRKIVKRGARKTAKPKAAKAKTAKKARRTR